jgi:hypothetical protein
MSAGEEEGEGGTLVREMEMEGIPVSRNDRYRLDVGLSIGATIEE